MSTQSQTIHEETKREALSLCTTGTWVPHIKDMKDPFGCWPWNEPDVALDAPNHIAAGGSVTLAARALCHTQLTVYRGE